jgi:putative hydrolase of the HAD superfamily
VVFQIFTNGDMVHAVRALERLGLEDCFEGIICFETLNPPCPPQGDQEPEIFDIAGHFARNVNPHKAVSFRALAPIIISVPVPDVAFTPEEPFFLIYFSV